MLQTIAIVIMKMLQMIAIIAWKSYKLSPSLHCLEMLQMVAMTAWMCPIFLLPNCMLLVCCLSETWVFRFLDGQVFRPLNTRHFFKAAAQYGNGHSPWWPAQVPCLWNRNAETCISLNKNGCKMLTSENEPWLISTPVLIMLSCSLSPCLRFFSSFSFSFAKVGHNESHNDVECGGESDVLFFCHSRHTNIECSVFPMQEEMATAHQPKTWSAH